MGVGLSRDGVHGYRNQGVEVGVALLTITPVSQLKNQFFPFLNFRCIKVCRSLLLEVECFHLKMEESHYGCHLIMSGSSCQEISK